MNIIKNLLFVLLWCVTISIQAQHVQSPLPYDFDALEPYIDAKTMKIHYLKHHAGYVNNLNKAITGTTSEQISLENILSGISAYSETVRNNAGGHFNHELFWKILTPTPNTQPSSVFANAVIANFTSIDSLKTLMNNAALGRFGSGWAWLVVTDNGKLVVTSTPNQDNPLMDVVLQKGIPVIGIDVWEHAYYLKYQNKRGEYLNAIWNIINWAEVSLLYETALKKIKP